MLSREPEQLRSAGPHVRWKPAPHMGASRAPDRIPDCKKIAIGATAVRHLRLCADKSPAAASVFAEALSCTPLNGCVFGRLWPLLSPSLTDATHLLVDVWCYAPAVGAN